MTISEIRKQRSMPFLKVGMRVFHTHNKKFGVVTGANNSQNINVKFDGDKFTQNCHPHWMMQYFDKDEKMIKEYKG